MNSSDDLINITTDSNNEVIDITLSGDYHWRDCYLELIDISGKLILNEQLQDEPHVYIKMNAYSPGIYFLRIILHDKNEINKIILRR